MASVGKEFHPELYYEIATDVDEELGHSGTEDVEMATEVAGRYGVVHHATPVVRPVKTQMCFELMSWRFEDYKEAVLEDEFFRTVAHMFPPYPTQTDPEKEQLERMKLLQAKYFVAGASARLMFDATTEDAIETLDTAIDEAPKIEPYLRRFAGDSGAANSLLARYELPYEIPYNYDVRLVSDYVVRKLATLMGPRLVRDFKRACNANPSTRGFNLEAWFFAELSHNDLAWSVYVESKLQQRQWGRSTIVFFDPDKYPIGVSLDGPTWMAPAKWNQGGYDAVFIDKAEQLVRFVQVTRAEHHTFDPIYFVMLLNRLVAGDLNQVAVVELCFVVPMDRLKAFRPPLSQEDFEKTVEQVACSESRATWSSPEHTLKNCSAKVMVIGVKCEISN